MRDWIFICLLYFSVGWQHPSPAMSYDLNWPSLGLFSHSLGSGCEKQEESLRDRDFRASKIITDSFYRHQKLCLYSMMKEWAFPAGPREKSPSTSWIHTRCHTHPLLRHSPFCSLYHHIYCKMQALEDPLIGPSISLWEIANFFTYASHTTDAGGLSRVQLPGVSWPASEHTL